MELSDIRRLTPITQEYAYFQIRGFAARDARPVNLGSAAIYGVR